MTFGFSAFFAGFFFLDMTRVPILFRVPLSLEALRAEMCYRWSDPHDIPAAFPCFRFSVRFVNAGEILLCAAVLRIAFDGEGFHISSSDRVRAGINHLRSFTFRRDLLSAFGREEFAPLPPASEVPAPRRIFERCRRVFERTPMT